MIEFSTRTLAIGGTCALALFAASCEKKKGGGSAWLVGQDGLMVNLGASGEIGPGYDLESDADLLDIACRGLDTAFVVGEQGTFLRTFDGGALWEQIDLGTVETLRSVATAGENIYVGGDHTLLWSPDSGTSWSALAVDPLASWRSVAAAARASYAIAVDDAGQIWRYDSGSRALQPSATLVGARAASLSHDGLRVVVAGAASSMVRSDDGGVTWRTVDLGEAVDLYGVWVTGAGDVIGVGAQGQVVSVDAADAVSITNPGGSTLRAVHVNGQGLGFAAGDDGEVLRTADGGGTWQSVSLGLSSGFFGVDEVAGEGHL